MKVKWLNSVVELWSKPPASYGIPSLTSSSAEVDSGANLAPMTSTTNKDAAVDKMISREAVERGIFRARREVYTH